MVRTSASILVGMHALAGHLQAPAHTAMFMTLSLVHVAPLLKVALIVPILTAPVAT